MGGGGDASGSLLLHTGRVSTFPTESELSVNCSKSVGKGVASGPTLHRLLLLREDIAASAPPSLEAKETRMRVGSTVENRLLLVDDGESMKVSIL